MKLFTSITAAALVGGASLFATPSAEAAIQQCWAFADGSSAPTLNGRPFTCDVSKRVNANGHTVLDVSHYRTGERTEFTVVLWVDKYREPIRAEVISNGQVQNFPYFIDSDGDIRIVMQDGQFIF